MKARRASRVVRFTQPFYFSPREEKRFQTAEAARCMMTGNKQTHTVDSRHTKENFSTAKDDDEDEDEDDDEKEKRIENSEIEKAVRMESNKGDNKKERKKTESD